MGFDNYFNGGYSFNEFNQSLNTYNTLIWLIYITVIVFIIIIILSVIAGRVKHNKEGFRHLLINRMKLANKGGNQSAGCASLNRGTRVTPGAWSNLLSNSKAVISEVDKSNEQINTANIPTSNNVESMDEILNGVKNEFNEMNYVAGTQDLPINPNSTIDPLDVENTVQTYVTGNMVNGNREPIISNGPVEREEFMTRTDKCNYAWMFNANNVMHNTDPKIQMDKKMRDYAKLNGFKK